MADSAAAELLDDLTSNIDDLTTSLEPLLSQPLHATAAGYAPLEKAKLYTLSTYAIESILLAYERIAAASSPDDARTHDIISELKRVQTYMQRIDKVEKDPSGEQKPESAKGKHTKFEDRSYVGVDTGAAGRFIKAGLAGNDRYDQWRAQRQEEGRAEAKRKFEGMNKGSGSNFTAKMKKSKRSKESVLDVADEDLELVKVPSSIAAAAVSSSPKKEKSKNKKKSKSGGDGT